MNMSLMSHITLHLIYMYIHILCLLCTFVDMLLCLICCFFYILTYKLFFTGDNQDKSLVEMWKHTWP